jgi:tRNA-binding EMAP/Myf-like protein
MVDTSQYKVGIVLSVENKAVPGKKPLKICSIDIGNATDGGGGGEGPITVVTNATNVRDGSRIVVAPIGSCVIDENGEELMIKRTVVSGTSSEGMLCDARMLGWGSGSAGIAAQVPETCAPGSAPPTTRPGGGGGGGGGGEGGEAALAPAAPGLFEKKLTKEEKKALAKAKRDAKKEAKSKGGEEAADEE